MDSSYIQRTLESVIKTLTTQFPVTLLTGPRQVGKTSLLQHLSQDQRHYVSLDDPALAALAQEDPKLFLERFKPPVLIDEVQYAPAILPYIKILVDQQQTAGLFWLTDSQQFHLMKGVAESLAGRIAIVNLLGLSQKEETGDVRHDLPFLPVKKTLLEQWPATKKMGLQAIYKKIWRGSFPRIVKNADIEPAIFYSSYVQTYLQRDVRDLTHVSDNTRFLRFLKVTAARTGHCSISLIWHVMQILALIRPNIGFQFWRRRALFIYFSLILIMSPKD